MAQPEVNEYSTKDIGAPDGILTNRSVVWIAPKKVELQDRTIPEIGPKDVMVKVIVTGICGSDAHVWCSNPSKQPPVMGHESAGVIVRLGVEVSDRYINQRVAIEPSCPCLECEFCIRGQTNLCAQLEYCGHTADGTLCQYFICRATMTVPIPESVSWKEAGCIQPLAISIQLARRANMRAHQTIAVFGCGPLGLLVIAVAKAYGVAKIIAFDIEQSRIDFAVKHGADIGLLSATNTNSEEPLSFATTFINNIIKQENLGSGVDLSIEASGAEACVHMSVVVTKPGGTYVQAGLGKQLVSVPLFEVTAKELTIKG
ncbi:hypothetical protein OIDMADRAFT_45674 [Oidiodendron maius Zn]|uniref:D-xylulose reductase n=1 Tax=Oidiodendron maius (strain Zn) TaxID=913774 RepID=A0A0C3CYL0_OIDMZ|nr:hypothetical protein OIDMADRAFT_45674 [Oidiodendron maius Zn]